MLVYKFRDDGVYVGETMEIEGPGWPADTTPDEPPSITSGQYLYYNFGQWYVKEGSIPEFVDERLIQFNKQQAMSLLSQTDWTTMADITTGTHKLTNQADFIAYRDQIRIIAVNPTANVTWPTMPTEQWSS